MDNNDLINAGYVRYEPLPFHECVTDLFEKCVRDVYGRRYFIHVERWDFSRYERGYVNYESEVQFTRKDGSTVNITALNVGRDWTIDGLEKFFSDMWSTGQFKYYEVKDEYQGEID